MNSDAEVVQYFCEEYYVESKCIKEKFLWIFPFLDELIVEAVNGKSGKTAILLDAAIKHNEKTYNSLKKAVLQVAKQIKSDPYENRGFQEVIADVLHDFHISDEKKVISFYYPFLRDSARVSTNIIFVNVKSKDPEIQRKIDRLNEFYFQILDIKNNLIKSKNT